MRPLRPLAPLLPRIPRLPRRIALGLVVLTALLLGGSAIIEPIAENVLRSAARRKTDSPSATIQLDAFPFALRALKGEIPRVTILARDSLHSGLRVALLRVEYRNVRLSSWAWLFGSRVIAVKTGTYDADVTQDALNAYLAAKGVPARVTLAEGSVVLRLRAPPGLPAHDVEAAGSLTVEGPPLAPSLIFSPTRATLDGRRIRLSAHIREAATLRLLLPPLPGGVAIRSVAVGDRTARFHAEVENWRHDLSE